MAYEDFVVDLLRSWVASLLSTLDTMGDRDTQAQLLEACGAACAVHHGDLGRVADLARPVPDLDALLCELNQRTSWCGAWRREGEAIVSVCEQCGCPLVREGLIERTPAFCECSRGYVKTLFGTALGRPVSVSLERAIGRGDAVCRFVVRPRDTKSPACAGHPVPRRGRSD